MIYQVWVQHALGILVFLVVLVLIALTNLRNLVRLGRARPPARWPRVSILLPARNEEQDIQAAVEALAGQQYPDFELIVLDDRSEDRTAEILAGLAGRLPRLRVLQGQPLPDGWLGKLWACQQLADAADGELLLFTDADTRHRPETLGQAVAQLEQDRIDLLTALPLEQAGGWAEKLVLPLLPWAILAFLPLGLAYRWRRPALTAANGQFMLFRRTSYDAIGGHAAVRRNVVDDLGLVRRLVGQGGTWRIYDAQDLVRCRMYRTGREVFDGFSKNLFGAFDHRLLLFGFVWSWVGIVTIEPLVVVALALAGVGIPGLIFGLAAGSVAAALLLWGISNRRFRFPWYVTPLYPLTVLLTLGIAARSLALALSGRAVWRGRVLPGARIRL